MQKEGEPRMNGGRQRSKPPCELLDAHNTTSTASARRLFIFEILPREAVFQAKHGISRIGTEDIHRASRFEQQVDH